MSSKHNGHGFISESFTLNWYIFFTINIQKTVTKDKTTKLITNWKQLKSSSIYGHSN